MDRIDYLQELLLLAEPLDPDANALPQRHVHTSGAVLQHRCGDRSAFGGS
jgi:hypothetical protein